MLPNEIKDVPVLLVDDEKNYLNDFLELFSKKMTLLTANGGEDALKVLENESVAVIVSDQRMPKMTGNQLLAEVATRHPNTIRILLTGYSDMEAVIDAVNKGHIYRYVSKDTPLKEIELVIRQGIEKYKLEESNRKLLFAKKRLLKSLSVEQTLSTVGIFGQQLHRRLEGLVMHLFNYVFEIGKQSSERAALAEFHRLQGALARLREMASFSEKLRLSSVGQQKNGLNLMIQEAVDKAREAVAKNGGCQIELDLAEKLPSLSVQRYSFIRLLKELLENAILFGPQEGKCIKIRARFIEATKEEESAIRIEVEDNGPGLSPEDLTKAFAPFFTTFETLVPPDDSLPPASDNYNLSPYYHYGFGLPIAQWIVCLRYGGTVDLVSQPGRGTTAVVILPAN